MRILLLNDTRDYHKGCKKVIEAIDHIYGFDDSIKTFDKTNLDELDYSKYDRVILNGEGTSFATGVGLVLKGYEDHIDPNAVMTTEQQVMQQDEEPFDEERVPLGRNFLKTLRDFFEADEEFQNWWSQFL